MQQWQKRRRRRRHGRLNPNVVKIWRKNQGHGRSRSRSRHSGTRIKKNKYPFSLFGKSEEEDVTTASSSSSSYRGYTLGDISPPFPLPDKKISLFIRQSEARTVRKKKKKRRHPSYSVFACKKKSRGQQRVF